ncbi:MAG: sugar ABC transporter substrate-binding protein [Thermomicrobiales bacterium]|nr:sugar ABC transporter substrate-binding protein [Thermomicrobiales bacterium]
MIGRNRGIDRRRLLQLGGAAGLGMAMPGMAPGRIGAQDPANFSREFEGTTINALMEDLRETTLIQEMLPEFEELTGIKVQFEKVVYPVMHDKLVSQLAAGEGNGTYDFLEVDFYWIYEFARSGWMQDLGPLLADSAGTVALSNYEDAVLKIGSEVDGTTYYVPMYVYPMGMLYRTDLFASDDFKSKYKEISGSDLTMPTSVEEYVAMISAAQQVDPGNLYGAAMQGMQGDPITMEFCNYLYSVGGDFFTEDMSAPAINNELGVKAAQLYVDAINNGAQPGAANADLNDTGALWRQGKALTAVSYLFLLSDGETLEDSQVKGKGSVTTMPGGTGLTGSWSWGIPVSSPNPGAAWEFLKWVESPEIAMRRALGGGVAAQKAPYENADYIAAFPWMGEVKDLIAVGKGFPAVTKQTQLVEIMGRHLSDAVTGGASAQDAMNAAADELKELL